MKNATGGPLCGSLVCHIRELRHHFNQMVLKQCGDTGGSDGCGEGDMIRFTLQNGHSG